MHSNRRRRALSIPILAFVIVGWAHGDGGQEPLIADASLRPAPSGDVLWGMLAAGSPVTVLDERDGWARVRVEGWIPATALRPRSPSAEAPLPGPPPSQPPPPEPPVPPPPGAAVERARGVTLEGTLSVRLSRRKRVSGEDSPVFLLPHGFQLQRDESEEATLADVLELEAEAERLGREAKAAADLPNFTEAMRRRDALLARRDGVLAERGELLARLHARHEAQARQAALASTETDGLGHYVLVSVTPGSYTLYGRLSRDRVEVEWLVPVSLGEDGTRVDLDETRALAPPGTGGTSEAE